MSWLTMNVHGSQGVMENQMKVWGKESADVFPCQNKYSWLLLLDKMGQQVLDLLSYLNQFEKITGRIYEKKNGSRALNIKQ